MKSLKMTSIRKDKDKSYKGVYHIDFSSGDGLSFQVRDDKITVWPSTMFMSDAEKEWYRDYKNHLLWYVHNFDFKTAEKHEEENYNIRKNRELRGGEQIEK